MNGEIIHAFNIGGELRLCLPQILRQILGQYHWEQASDSYFTNVIRANNMIIRNLNKFK